MGKYKNKKMNSLEFIVDDKFSSIKNNIINFLE